MLRCFCCFGFLMLWNYFLSSQVLDNVNLLFYYHFTAFWCIMYHMCDKLKTTRDTPKNWDFTWKMVYWSTKFFDCGVSQQVSWRDNFFGEDPIESDWIVSWMMMMMHWSFSGYVGAWNYLVMWWVGVSHVCCLMTAGYPLCGLRVPPLHHVIPISMFSTLLSLTQLYIPTIMFHSHDHVCWSLV
jgi:hypothetical protein